MTRHSNHFAAYVHNELCTRAASFCPPDRLGFDAKSPRYSAYVIHRLLFTQHFHPLPEVEDSHEFTRGDPDLVPEKSEDRWHGEERIFGVTDPRAEMQALREAAARVVQKATYPTPLGS